MGARVANVLMKRLGILEDDKTNDEYVRPLFVYCQLPGKYNYLHAEVPFLRSMKTFTKSLSTGNATDGYFEIVVNSTGEVLELSCYSNKVSLYCITYHTLEINMYVFIFVLYVIYLFISLHLFRRILSI